MVTSERARLGRWPAGVPAAAVAVMRLLVASLVLATGCIDVAEPPPVVDCSQFSGRLFPLEVGRQWTYQVTDDGDAEQKIQDVVAFEEVPERPGVVAHRVVTTKPKGAVTSWQADTGT